MSWEPELDELARRTELARRMGGEEKVARHRAQGKLTVRERIDALLDAARSTRSARSPDARPTTTTATSSTSRPRTS